MWLRCFWLWVSYLLTIIIIIICLTTKSHFAHMMLTTHAHSDFENVYTPNDKTILIRYYKTQIAQMWPTTMNLHIKWYDIFAEINAKNFSFHLHTSCTHYCTAGCCIPIRSHFNKSFGEKNNQYHWMPLCDFNFRRTAVGL